MPAQSLTETYTGSVVDWYVPNHTAGTLRVTCRGADGMRAAGHPNGRGGYGGSVRGYLNVTPGTLLKLVVGAGGLNLTPPTFMAKGGFPEAMTDKRGGCATEVWDASSTRIMVAGGGGTGAYGSSGGSGRGYDGGLGIADGETQGTYSFGGTLTAHGAAGANGGGGGTAATAGSSAGGGYGTGGNGGAYILGHGGGGGGGYYNGGGGGATAANGFGGGGGSSWCDTGLFSSVDNVGKTGATGHSAEVLIVWDGDPVWIHSGTCGVPRSFTFTGYTQAITVPSRASQAVVTLAGAAGGGSQASTTRSKGGLVEGVVDVTPGATLYINVGGKGAHATSGTGGAGGWPTGAAGGTASSSTAALGGGGGGGGSDIRQGGTAVTDIIAAAGGGGGRGALGTTTTSQGGDGGGVNGDNGTAGNSNDVGAGGTPTAGGANAPNTSGVNGSKGNGGTGGGGFAFSSSNAGGGGGGGWFGGEGGASNFASNVGGGGGGGSGYVTTGTYTTGGNTTSDDGYISIEWVCSGGIYVDGAVH